jgi:hypothetical protein
MIVPNWVHEDLDPVTWRAIGRFFLPAQYIAAAQPGEHGLFVLHDAGNHPRVADTVRGVRTDLGVHHVDNPRALAAELYARGEWDRVHVIDKHHLAHVSAEAQSTPRRELSVDAYYHLVYQLLWNGSDGYVCEPPPAGNWHGLTCSASAGFLRRAPTPSTVALCVPGSIGLVLRLEHGRIVRATTFESLPPLPEPSVTPEFLETLWQHLAAPYAVLVCTPAVWEAALAAPNLLEWLRTAEALWRLADDNDAYTDRV